MLYFALRFYVATFCFPRPNEMNECYIDSSFAMLIMFARVSRVGRKVGRFPSPLPRKSRCPGRDFLDFSCNLFVSGLYDLLATGRMQGVYFMTYFMYYGGQKVMK